MDFQNFFNFSFKEKRFIWQDNPSNTPESQGQAPQQPENPEQQSQAPETPAALKARATEKAQKIADAAEKIVNTSQDYTSGFVEKCQQIANEANSIISNLNDLDISIDENQDMVAIFQTSLDGHLGAFTQDIEAKQELSKQIKEEAQTAEAGLNFIESSLDEDIRETIVDIVIGDETITPKARISLKNIAKTENAYAAVIALIGDQETALQNVQNSETPTPQQLEQVRQIQKELDEFDLTNYITAEDVDYVKEFYQENPDIYAKLNEEDMSDAEIIEQQDKAYNILADKLGEELGETIHAADIKIALTIIANGDENIETEIYQADYVPRIKELIQSGQLKELGIQEEYYGSTDARILSQAKQPLKFYNEMGVTFARMADLDSQGQLKPPLSARQKKLIETFLRTDARYALTMNMRGFLERNTGLIHSAYAFRRAETAKRNATDQEIGDQDNVEINIIKGGRNPENRTSGINLRLIENTEQQDDNTTGQLDGEPNNIEG